MCPQQILARPRTPRCSLPRVRRQRGESASAYHLHTSEENTHLSKTTKKKPRKIQTHHTAGVQKEAPLPAAPRWARRCPARSSSHPHHESPACPALPGPPGSLRSLPGPLHPPGSYPGPPCSQSRCGRRHLRGPGAPEAAPRRPAPGLPQVRRRREGTGGDPGEIPEDPGGARIPLRAPLPACGHPCGLPSLPGAAGLASFPVSSLSPSPLPLRRGTREGRGASPGAFQSRGVPLASVRVLGAACSVPGEPASRLGAAFRSLRSGHLAY